MSWSGPDSHPSARQLTGQIGEDAALAHLILNGLTLVERNFRCKGGEIDLVMQEHRRGREAKTSEPTLVFVEVRKRADMQHGGAAASVTQAKQRRLIIAAQTFLQRYRMLPTCRFDVVAIDGDTLTWLKNAIEA